MYEKVRNIELFSYTSDQSNKLPSGGPGFAYAAGAIKLSTFALDIIVSLLSIIIRSKNSNL